MPNYRRLFVPGGSWFFTVNALDRHSQTLVDNIRALRQSIFRVKRQLPFRVEALVILPDHMHAIWTLPAGDSDFPKRWRLIKSHFSRRLAKTEHVDQRRLLRGERGVWQRRYWEHYIRDGDDMNAHIAYCYFNPVKHRLVESVGDWPLSTFHRDVRAGRALPDVRLSASLYGAFGE